MEHFYCRHVSVDCFVKSKSRPFSDPAGILKIFFAFVIPVVPLIRGLFFSDTIFLADSKIINVRIPGAQRSVLERIISEGPIGLVNPSKYYTECKEAGLRPCFLDSLSHTIVPSQVSTVFPVFIL